MNEASTSSTSGEEPPVSWASATPIEGADPSPGVAVERRLGFPASDLADLIPLPDDVEALAGLLEAEGLPFAGAFVPVVVHDTAAAERSYDAAEWAADLIRTAGGDLLAVATYAGPDGADSELNPRQWNHAAAMIERLDGVCQRFRLRIAIHETVGGAQVGQGSGIDPARPLRHLLDTGRFVADDYVPVQLLCPHRAETQGGLVGRFRGMLRDRT